jgi:hypothetical protein
MYCCKWGWTLKHQLSAIISSSLDSTNHYNTVGTAARKAANLNPIDALRYE